MWLKNRKTNDEFRKQIDLLCANEPEEHPDDVIFFSGNSLTYEYKAKGYSISYYFDMIKTGKVEKLTQEQVLETIENNSLTFATALIRNYRNDLDDDELIAIYKSILKNDVDINSRVKQNMLIREYGSRGLPFMNEFKDELKSIVINEKNQAAIATYIHQYSVHDLSDREIKDIFKSNPSNFAVMLEYARQEDLQKISKMYNSLSCDELREAAKRHVENWVYTPLISKEETGMLMQILEGKRNPFEVNKSGVIAFLSKVASKGIGSFSVGDLIRPRRSMIKNACDKNFDCSSSFDM
ncbi:hypothetical protein [Vibrio metschnikovii]|uniref:Uncharacterized protein n=1 Tax=Vibrio metschnikovii TaxID=28172 RepID=A0A9X0R7Z7_VIBME|nr:hypothetical protein [Vibrio metschnikovii]MBC5851414.1 hypothetical protein [Vibrio metschnikovii]